MTGSINRKWQPQHRAAKGYADVSARTFRPGHFGPGRLS